MAGEFRYPRGVRLTSAEDYRRVLRGGVRVSTGGMRLVVARNPSGDQPLRLGTAVSRRVGNAVARNRVRRRLRESFRLDRAALPVGYDVVCIPFAEVRGWRFTKVRASLRDLILRGCKRLDENA